MEKKRRVLPPVWLLLTLISMWAIDRWWPLAVFDGAWPVVVGGVLIVVGLGIAATAAGAFKRAGTPIIPFEPSTALVTSGLYRYTRNPMYLGMLLLLLGVALVLRSAGAFLPIPVFMWIIQSRFIEGEERFLEDIFGDAYVSYKRQVRRWL